MINSPVRYQGSKRKIIDRIQQLLPTDVKRSVDVFGGSGVVCANLFTPVKVFNEISPEVSDIIHWLATTEPKDSVRQIIRLINKWKLDRENQDQFLKFRADAQARPTPVKHFVLHRFAHSNLLRFNRKGQYNANFGFRAVDIDLLKKEVRDFHQAMGGTTFHQMDYVQLMKALTPILDSDTFLYFDPPYLASGSMQYSNKWSKEDEHRLLKVLDVLDGYGCKWMLSNVLSHRQFTNEILREWVNERGHNIEHLDIHYKFAHIIGDVHNGTDEVIITNY